MQHPRRMHSRTILLVLLGGAMLGGCAAAGPVPARTTPETHDDADVHAGYEAYRDALAPSGSWERDDVYGVRWCPREDQLHPTPASFSPLAPSRDGAAWHAITSRGGRWVHDLTDAGRWCWVPSAEANGASVVTRAPRPRGTTSYAEAARPAPTPEPTEGEKAAKEISGAAYDLAAHLGAAAAAR